ncbi:MAG: hemerythrin domain-containing protein [Thiofilum sp.]|uniref:hemerythrin domain-containing protein n=1 Tax=Thiofilum sp. TaxID=2212733 RepID=UPI0025F62F73|nr:hemerythrin domain-containing protein [Thiofilum sp.]MBK8454629.1 hemerythrin domain-containing protein [Thiofilum sp.]
MHKILADLHQDHINLATLLGLLEEQVHYLAEGDDANLWLILDIADYIERYSDYVHHPKEDRVYAVLAECTSENADTLTELLAQHHQLPNDTLTFQALIKGVLYDDAIVLRDGLVAKINEFIAAQKQHMNLEEGIIFPLIQKHLKPNHWNALENSLLNAEDPLFGAKVMERYEQLYAVVSEKMAA